MANTKSVLVTGGAGYVGAVLVPALIHAGHSVTVLDLYLYGEEALDPVRGHERLREVKGDLRDPAIVADALRGCDSVIHLACISNDPSFELDPDLGKSINLDAFRPLVRASKAAGVRRFIYASSSSVYGVKDDPEVVESLSLEPLTDYSRFKADCERILLDEREQGFVTVSVRPATVCGYSPRQRLDVVVNILTNLAIHTGQVKVFGGDQKRPNIHIQDMVDFYLNLLDQPDEKIDGEVFNVGFENHTVSRLADMVIEEAGPHVQKVVEPSNDARSYHINSDHAQAVLGFRPSKTIRDAISDLAAAFRGGKLTAPLENPRYYNIKMMQELRLK